MVLVAASILSADFSKLGEEITQVDKSGVNMIHVDVMDGRFVPNLSMGFPIVKAVRQCTELPLDVHLMIHEPERYIHRFVNLKVDRISVHFEACTHLHRTLQLIKENGLKTGVVFKKKYYQLLSIQKDLT